MDADSPHFFVLLFFLCVSSVLSVLLIPQNLRFPRRILGRFGDEFSRVGVASRQEGYDRRPRFLIHLIAVSLRHFVQETMTAQDAQEPRYPRRAATLFLVVA